MVIHPLSLAEANAEDGIVPEWSYEPKEQLTMNGVPVFVCRSIPLGAQLFSEEWKWRAFQTIHKVEPAR